MKGEPYVLPRMKCPNCRTESEGRFCPSCGTPLAGSQCPSCKAPLQAGARFCTQCGKSVRGGKTATSASQLPWIIAGAALIVAIAAVLLPGIRGAPAQPAGGEAPFASGGGNGSPPPLSGTPREQADRLFNRIMQERSQGNEEQARFFVPMAVQAYQSSQPLDADGLYHLSLIHAVGGDYASAKQVAEQILASSPNHLLGLAALAEATAGLGDNAAARTAWQNFLSNLKSEKAKNLPEYLDHSRILEQYEIDARTKGGG
jgi:hypothetical protein